MRREGARRGPRAVWPAGVLLLLLAAAAAPAAAGGWPLAVPGLDADGNGVEDLLDRWAAGLVSWPELRAQADGPAEAVPAPVPLALPAGGAWERGEIRLLWLGRRAGELQGARRAAAAAGGACEVVHDLEPFGGACALAVDAGGLRALLAVAGPGLLLLDRDGRPALDRGRALVAAGEARRGPWRLRGDWTSSIAILDSGCDTAHDDLGDFSHDDIDGPPPAVGHAMDWYPAEVGWPVFDGYRVIGWHDVTDDFPEAAGPWDYHHHGTALAGAVGGAGLVDPAYAGVAAKGRLTIVKFYDFDGVWRRWAGDFLAACAWVVQNRAPYRVRAVLAAVNWDADLGIGLAVQELAEAGILTIVAMGNEGPGAELGYPARLPLALSVGAVDDEGAVAAYANRGTHGSGKPDLVAPGGGLLPQRGRITTTDNEPNDTYTGRRGTSLAAAHAAGVVSLVSQAWRDEGLPAAAGLEDVRLLSALLRITAGPVAGLETAAGAVVPHPSLPLPDEVRGWGLLQAPAAVEALLLPLASGEVVLDSLGGGDGRLTVARRLLLPPGAACVLEARPSSELDVRLRVHPLRPLFEADLVPALALADRAGSGGAETLDFQNRLDGPVVVVVERISGSGLVVLAALPPAGSEGRFRRALPGLLTGVNAGRPSGAAGEALVLTCLSDADPALRLIDAIGPDGASLPGWPVPIIVSSTLHRGGLGRPLVWDLDGQAGDEVVVASEFGRVYFLLGGAPQLREPVTRDVGLGAPVGIAGTAGRRVLVGAGDGSWHLYDGSGTRIRTARPSQTAVLPPAAGLLAGPGESAVVLHAGGRAAVLDAEGNELSGWPVQVAAACALPPLLVDLDGDGQLEIVIVTTVPPASMLSFRVLTAAGTPGTGDGTAIAAPGGGRWLALCPPLAADGEGGRGRVFVAGLADVSGGQGWRLWAASLTGAGEVAVAELPGFRVPVRTPFGVLALRTLVWGGPLAWDRGGLEGPEPAWLALLRWEEEIPGLEDIAGSALGWFGATRPGPPPAARLPLASGGAHAEGVLRAGAALYRVAGGWAVGGGWDRRLQSDLAAGPARNDRAWRSARADGRNGGGLAAAAVPTGVPSGPSTPQLTIGPNPGSGSLELRWRDLPPGPVELAVYDLRGRLVRRLAAAGGAGAVRWDGRDDAGRPAAAGSYLVALRHADGSLGGRAVLAR